MVGARKLMKVMHLRRTTRAAAATMSQFDGASPQWIETEIHENSPVCRACLKAGDIPIYGNYHYPDLSREFQGITGIKIQVYDEFPKYMCEDCYSLLQSGVQLRNVAQCSDRVLRPDSYTPHSDDNVDNDDHGVNDDFFDQDNGSDNDVLNNIKIKQEQNIIQKRGPKYKKPKREIDPKELADRKYECSTCNIFFDTERDYAGHKASWEHRNFKATCPVCQKEFNAIYLKYHMRYHREEITNVCDQCGKEFKMKALFDSHRKIHTKELPFKCQQCPYRGRCKYSLRMHMRTHTGDKPYKCPQCPDRAFINKANLNRHLYTHQGEKNYKCDQCQRSFHFKPELERHVRAQHHGIKDHICNLCGKAFGLRSHMMKHQAKVHNRKKSTTNRRPLYLMPEYQNQEDSENDHNDRGQSA